LVISIYKTIFDLKNIRVRNNCDVKADKLLIKYFIVPVHCMISMIGGLGFFMLFGIRYY